MPERLPTVATPVYKTDGTLWHVHETPSGACIQFHCDMTTFSPIRWYPQHINDAISNYRDTLRALLLAGF